MRVGLDGYPLAEPRTGIGHYTFELARALAHNFPDDEFELVSPKPFHASLAEFERDAIPNLLLTNPKSSSIRGHWWSIGLPLYARRAGFDVFHGTNYELPLWNRRRSAVTIHDLSALAYPEMLRPALARRLRMRLPLTLKLARAIITPTEAVKRELCERLKLNPEKIIAIHEAARPSFKPMLPADAANVRKRLGIETDFLLFVGTLEPRKNLATLLKAFARMLRQSKSQPQLVIAGGEGWLMEKVGELMKSEDIGDRLRIIGYTKDRDLCALYSSCRVFIYPSVYEGFGLPPLEAMACGAPVVASRIPALQETLADAAIFVEPLDAPALADTMVELLNNESLRADLAAKGLKRAAKFSWDEAARATHRVYEQIL